MTSGEIGKLTRELLQADGYAVDITERWLPRGKTTKDLFGFADMVAVKEGEVGTLYVQATTIEHMTDRLEKIRREPRARTVLLSGNRILLVGWRLAKALPGSRGEWIHRLRWIQTQDL